VIPIPLRVLVIDDEPDVLVLCRINLEHAGHEVWEATTGEEGLAIARAEPPDVIVLDVMLPTLDGISVLRELGDGAETDDVPVVLLTAKSRLEDQIRGWRAGAAGYVTKPFSPGTLTDMVRRVHDMSPAERDVIRRQVLVDLERLS
jgi:DNA-binding response OmpR family regulator